MTPITRWAAVAAIAAGAAGLAGCNRDRTAGAVADMNPDNAHRLSNLYAAHQNFKGGKGPKDEAAFKTFVREFDATKLGMMGVDPANVDVVFVSDRDGQPFKVRYGVGGGRGSNDPVVFEQVGKDGKKQVGYTSGTVQELADGEADRLLAAKPAPPAKNAKDAGKDGRTTGAPAGAPPGPPG